MLKFYKLCALNTTGILLLFISILLSSGCTPNTDGKPDIVLITLDTTRWDYLHAYGYELPNTPNLDELAEKGSKFNNAVSVAGTTFPAHASMLTGLYPRSHGARSNFFSLNKNSRTVAQILAENGYQTASFVSFKGMHRLGKLDRGFQVASDRKRISGDKTPIRPGDQTLKMTIDWLLTAGIETPIFLWMHLFEPHGPYNITPWFEQNFPNYNGLFSSGVEMGQIKEGRKLGFRQDDLDAMRQIYAGEIAVADQYVGQLLEQLENRGQLDNTIVIVVADHGQGMGENNHFGHGALLWESVLRVPLIITDFRQPKATVVDQRVGLIDLSPTILSAAKIDIPTNMAGRSLFPLDNPAGGKDRLYYAEVKLIEEPDEGTQLWYDPTDLAVYLDEYKLQRRKGKNTLFSSSVDSNELTPIAVKKAESLFYFLSDSASSYLENEGQVEKVKLDAETLKELQGLGYTQ